MTQSPASQPDPNSLPNPPVSRVAPVTSAKLGTRRSLLKAAFAAGGAALAFPAIVKAAAIPRGQVARPPVYQRHD